MSVTLSTYAKKTHASLDLKGMHLNPFSLRFSGPCAYLEDTFQREYLEKSLKHIRVALILAVILYAAFGVLDAILIPGKKHLTWMIRYAFVCPAMLLVLLLSRFRIVQRRIQPILAGLIVIGGAGINQLVVGCPHSGRFF